MILLDTDHLTVLTNRHAAGHRLLVRHLAESEDQRIAIPVVSVEEQCRGWLAKIHRLQQPIAQVSAYQDFQDLFELLRGWEIVPFSRAAAERFLELKVARIRIGTNDLKIGSIALVNEALLLSANLRDFEQIPGLLVENWLE
ncbi:MAG: putative nucleic acid-binding protein contains PIN domain [Planctomycetota bacterium]|nr:MAG: putative nucleic acid-binding protein contains PIN domain [Planctomycetota bacterium]